MPRCFAESPVPRVCCLIALVLLTGRYSPAQAEEGITVELRDHAGNPGQTVEVPVRLYTGVYAPTTMVLWIGYDPTLLTPVDDYFETIVRDGQGNPVLDDGFQVMTLRSGVRADFSLEETGKTLAVAYHPDEGAIAISLVGLGSPQQPIPEGPLMTLAFRIAPGLSVGRWLEVTGHDADNPVVVQDVERRSSASDADGSIDLDMIDGGILMVNCSPPDLPGNVSASQGRNDGVLISWDMVEGSSVEYRVYRADTDDLTAALPLGEKWQQETEFLDMTARGDHVIPSTCSGAPMMEGPTYYYWVASRDAFGCEQPPAGASVSGHRGGSKASIGGLGEQAGVAALLLLALVLPTWLRSQKRDG